jgi:hypothetical protein
MPVASRVVLKDMRRSFLLKVGNGRCLSAGSRESPGQPLTISIGIRREGINIGYPKFAAAIAAAD